MYFRKLTSELEYKCLHDPSFDVKTSLVIVLHIVTLIVSCVRCSTTWFTNGSVHNWLNWLIYYTISNVGYYIIVNGNQRLEEVLYFYHPSLTDIYVHCVVWWRCIDHPYSTGCCCTAWATDCSSWLFHEFCSSWYKN